MSYHGTDNDDIEQYRITDADGDVFARLTYFDPTATPSWRYNSWVVDFANGDRLTGDAANEVVKRFLSDPGTNGTGTSRFGEQADALLDTVVYEDDDSRMYQIRVRGVRLWFRTAVDDGDDVALYGSMDRDTRVGTIDDPPFSADELRTAASMARKEAKNRV